MTDRQAAIHGIAGNVQELPLVVRGLQFQAENAVRLDDELGAGCRPAAGMSGAPPVPAMNCRMPRFGSGRWFASMGANRS